MATTGEIEEKRRRERSGWRDRIEKVEYFEIIS